MVGGQGPRLLAATLAHVDAWNVWYTVYGNTPEGFAALGAKVDANVRRSACVLVSVGGGAGERPPDEGAPPVDARRLDEHLRELADAGADEAILVLDPIDEATIATVAELV